MSLVRIVTGSESLANGLSGMLVQVPTSNRVQTQGGKPVFISDAAKSRTGGISQPAGRSVFLSAARTGLKEQGSWFDGNFDVPDGVILRIFARRHERLGRSGHAMPLQRAVMFIRMRQDAALRRLTLNTINDPQSAGVVVAIEGRFDVLSLREAGAEKVALTHEDLMLSKVEAVREVLVHEEISAQRAAQQRIQRERVQTDEGEVVVETKRSPRAVNLD